MKIMNSNNKKNRIIQRKKKLIKTSKRIKENMKGITGIKNIRRNNISQSMDVIIKLNRSISRSNNSKEQRLINKYYNNSHHNKVNRGLELILIVFQHYLNKNLFIKKKKFKVFKISFIILF